MIYDAQIITLILELLNYGLKPELVMITDEAANILELCNAHRTKAGLLPLKINNTLAKLALLKSEDMVENDYFSHNSLTYGTVFDMLHKHGLNYFYAGENLAIDANAVSAYKAWMNSEAHKKNILFSKFRETGIGVCPKSKGSYVYTQLFLC